ncbi:MAG: hypothetical protein P4L79_18420 [Legionella sp.]|uniref:hypothetical protein n=1 Tax=Legionella sp. TaxID=459 RepID=UPI00284B1C96|nr:hypothetical protein [Legionella sp.]
MENCRNEVTRHPELLEVLFAFRSKVSSVFRDVLGIHEIDHIAFARVNKNNQLLTLSSTPAMEFNLFNSPLWRYDKSYRHQWFELCVQDYWQNLYDYTRYDELYYLKQIKHAYPIGLSLAAKMGEEYLIYSLASRKSCVHTRELFANQHEDFYKIGQYCSNNLIPLLNTYDHSSSSILPIQVEL